MMRIPIFLSVIGLVFLIAGCNDSLTDVPMAPDPVGPDEVVLSSAPVCQQSLPVSPNGKLFELNGVGIQFIWDTCTIQNQGVYAMETYEVQIRRQSDNAQVAFHRFNPANILVYDAPLLTSGCCNNVLSNLGSYKWRIRAIYRGSPTAWSIYKTFRVTLPAPSSVSGSVTSAGSPKLTWSSVSGANGYRVTRKEEITGNKTHFTVSGTSFTDSALLSFRLGGTTMDGYTYSVRAKDATGNYGKVSNGVYFTPDSGGGGIIQF